LIVKITDTYVMHVQETDTLALDVLKESASMVVDMKKTDTLTFVMKQSEDMVI